jgi:trimeric autotransporter adhesin
MPITAIVEGQVVAGGTATGVIYVTAAGVVASDGPTWNGTTFTVTGPTVINGFTAAQVGLSIVQPSTPSANAFQISSVGTAAGDVVKIDSAGHSTFAGNVIVVSDISSPGAGANSETFGKGSTASGTNSVSAGFNATTTAQGVAVGATATSTSTGGVAVGYSSNAGLTSTAIGYQSDAGYNGSTALGSHTTTTVQGVAVGQSATSTATGGVAVGYSSNAANTSTAIGYQSDAGFFGSTALGAYATTTANNQIVYGRNTITQHLFPSGAVTFRGSVSHSPDGTGKLTRGMASETHTLSLAATSDTTTISIPSGARLLAVQMNVDTAVTDGAGDNTWSAAFVTGSTTTIATAAAAAQNTKVNLMLPDEITTGIAEIRFTPNGGSFTAGIIQITCYYEFLTSLANA